MLTVYTKPDCDFCRDAKIFLNAFNVHYEEIDISKNEEASEFVKARHKTVPQIYKNGTLFIEGGFVGLVTSDTNLLTNETK